MPPPAQQLYSNEKDVFSVYMMHKYVNHNSAGYYPAVIAVTEFVYLWDWPIWKDPKLKKGVSLRDTVLLQCGYHWEAIKRADLRYPILAVRDMLGRYSILDGHHRLGKALVQKKKTIKAYVFDDPQLLRKFHLGVYSPATYRKYERWTKAQFDALYKKRFESA